MLSRGEKKKKKELTNSLSTFSFYEHLYFSLAIIFTESLMERTNDCFIEPFLSRGRENRSPPPLIFVNIRSSEYLIETVFTEERENGCALKTSNLIDLSEFDVYNGIEV